MSGSDLLPSSSTQLERDLSLSADLLRRLEGGPPKIRTGKRLDIQDDVIPWLILEYGLGELLPYIPDQRQAVREGVKWQRVRGTPAAVRTALGWIGFDALIEESEAGSIRWADFQLGLDQAPNGLQFTENVVQVSRLSSPVRSRLFRIYGGWFDFRRFKLDDHGLSTGSWLCDHTGVYLEQDRDVPWPQLSFGRELQRTESFTRDFTVGTSLHRKRTDLGFYEDRLILDFNQLSDLVWKPFHMDVARAVISRMHFQQWGPIWQRTTDWVLGAWDSTFDWANKVNAIQPALKFCKAGLYLSDTDAVLGDTNACLPARYEEEIGVGTLLLSESDAETGEGILSEHRSNVVEREILERFERNTDAEAIHDASTHQLGAITDKAHHSEKTFFHPYQDVIRLSHTRLSEWVALVHQYSNTRAHTTDLDQRTNNVDEWQATTLTWASDPTGTWETIASYFETRSFGDAWDSQETWESGEYFSNAATDTWQNTYSWIAYPQLEQYFEETVAELDLSEENVFGDLNYRLGSEFGAVQERIHSTENAGLAVTPNYIRSLDRLHKRVLVYDDKFRLDLHRLGEFPMLLNEAAYSRLHSYSADLQRYFQDTWNDSSPAWDDASGHAWSTFPGWYDEADELTWQQVFSWVDKPELERYQSFAKAAIVLSDSDPLTSTNATLGWDIGDERFDRVFVTVPSQYSTQTFETRQHQRHVQSTAYWLPAESDWSEGMSAGPNPVDWNTSTETWEDDPTVDSWGNLDWLEGETSDWDSSFMWATIRRWTVLSEVVESHHTTT